MLCSKRRYFTAQHAISLHEAGGGACPIRRPQRGGQLARLLTFGYELSNPGMELLEAVEDLCETGPLLWVGGPHALKEGDEISWPALGDPRSRVELTNDLRDLVHVVHRVRVGTCASEHLQG